MYMYRLPCKLNEDAPFIIKPHPACITPSSLVPLARLACQVNDGQSVSGAPAGLPTSPGEALSKRCVQLVRTSLKPDIWPSKSNCLYMYVCMYVYMYMYDVCT